MVNGKSSSSGPLPGAGDRGPQAFVRPDLLGYVFHLTWIYLLFYNVEYASATIVGVGAFVNPVYLTSLGALVLMLLVGSLRTHAFMHMAQSGPMVVVAPLVTSLGTVSYGLYGTSGLSVFLWAGGAMTGFGSAVLAARWAAAFGNASPRAVIANFPLILAAVAAIAVTVEYVPQPVWFALLVLLPLLSGACLEYARAYQRGLGSSPAPAAVLREGHRLKINGLLIALIALLGACLGIMSSFAEADLFGSQGGYDVLFNILTAVFVLAYVGMLIFKKDRAQFVGAFVVPLGVLAFVLLPYAQLVAPSPWVALGAVGGMAFELLLLFGVVMVALYGNLSPARTFMIARATYGLSNLAGDYIGNALMSWGGTVGLQVMGVVLFAASEMLLLALVAVFVLGRRGGAAAKDAADGVAGGERGEGSVAGEPDRVGGASYGAPDANGALAGQTDRCAQVAERYGLSSRELDVLRLLAQGKTSATIQAELCIAQGMVNYHLRNIYAKTGVHTRQEFMLLVLGNR